MLRPLLASLVVLATTSLSAQSTPTAPPTPAAKAPAAVVAGIPANYDQARVGTYTLPDALRLADGKRVTTAKAWFTKRRPQIVHLFETQQYGIAPGRPAAERFEITDKGTIALGRTAIRKQITIHLTADPTGPAIHLLEYIPAAAKKPVPMFLAINFGANQSAVNDPGITPQLVWDSKTHAKILPPAHGFAVRIDTADLLAAGFASPPSTTAMSSPTTPPASLTASRRTTSSPAKPGSTPISGAPSPPGPGV